MPTPVSSISTIATVGPALVRTVSVPPFGIASIGIQHQVEEDLADLIGVAEHVRQIRRRPRSCGSRPGAG